MALISLQYVPKNGPNLLSGFPSDVREEVLASYVQLGARAKDPDFAYNDGQRVGEFIVKAKDRAVEAVNADLADVMGGKTTLRFVSHAGHQSYPLTVRAATAGSVASALIKAYDEVLIPADGSKRKTEPHRTLLGALTTIVAQAASAQP